MGAGTARWGDPALQNEHAWEPKIVHAQTVNWKGSTLPSSPGLEWATREGGGIGPAPLASRKPSPAGATPPSQRGGRGNTRRA